MLSVATILLSCAGISFTATPTALCQELEPSSAATTADAIVISHEERIKRALIHGPGSRFMVQLVLDAAVEREIKRRKKAGLFVGDVEISQEDIDFEVQRQMEMVLAQDPTVDFWAMMRAQGFTKKTLARELRRNLVVQQMFFPLDPSDWPVEQIKEIMPERWQEHLKGEYEQLLAMQAKGESQALNELSVKQFLLPDIWLWLRDQCTVLLPSHGLPEGICLQVDDKEFRTDEVLATVEPLFTLIDRQWVDTFVGNIELLEADLKASGHYLTDEQFEAYFAEEKALYNKFFTHEMLVLQYYGFPSMENYRQYLRVRRSFRMTLPAEDSPAYQALLDQVLEAHQKSYGGGKVKADVLLLSARDKATGLFPMTEDSYLKAEAVASEVAKLLKSGEDFGQILLEYSDYLPSVTAASNTATQANRGRFDSIPRAELRGLLAENSFTDFLFGYSITDDIFFRASDGQVYGPVRGPLGYYFYRVHSHSAPRLAVDLKSDPSMNWMVNEDLLSIHFYAHLNQLRK